MVLVSLASWYALWGLPGAVLAVPMTVIIPSFIISELKTAFQIGFILFIPFLIISLDRNYEFISKKFY